VLPAIVMALVLQAGEVAASDDGSARACWATAQAQRELNHCAALELGEADAELNRVYEEVRARHAADGWLLTHLRSAQRAWIALRDADIESIWSRPDPEVYGSSAGMCRSMMLARMTRERTAHLRRWLEPSDEGDICDGAFSVEEPRTP
jgi:uncharacterized protein YecT (DUF1311 family)